MARKQIVFVIVEGPSDEEALGAILSGIYDKNAVYIHIVHGDLTTRKNTATSNIVSKIGIEVRQYANSRHFKKSDFREIIHIVDTDGAYIPDEAIVADEKAEHATYSEREIRTRYKRDLERRNQQKRVNLNILTDCEVIWGLPYRIFYMSCNLDHVLYNKLNSSDEEKEADSFHFAKQYRHNIPLFLEYIGHSDFSVTDGYASSWDYIKEGLHSLERHTNLALCWGEREHN